MIYQYPTDESITDTREAWQDPQKRLREMAMIQAMLAFPWRNAMDFGCGLGRNFGLFFEARPQGAAARLHAVEPDLARLDKARREGAQYIRDDFAIDYGTAADIADPATLDLILCCQVVPHQPTKLMREMFDTFNLILAPGGVMIICAPFHVGPPGGESFHAIDPNRRVYEDVVRRPLTRREFDRTAADPPAGVLPVRTLATRFSTVVSSNADLPVACAPPRLFARDPRFRCAGCFVYSVHEFRGGQPLIGDFIIKLVKEPSSPSS